MASTASQNQNTLGRDALEELLRFCTTSPDASGTFEYADVSTASNTDPMPSTLSHSTFPKEGSFQPFQHENQDNTQPSCTPAKMEPSQASDQFDAPPYGLFTSYLASAKPLEGNPQASSSSEQEIPTTPLNIIPGPAVGSRYRTRDSFKLACQQHACSFSAAYPGPQAFHFATRTSAAGKWLVFSCHKHSQGCPCAVRVEFDNNTSEWVITSANYAHSAHSSTARIVSPAQRQETAGSSPRSCGRKGCMAAGASPQHKPSLRPPVFGVGNGKGHKSASPSPPLVKRWDIDTTLANTCEALRPVRSAVDFKAGHSASFGRDVRTYKPQMAPSSSCSPYPLPFKRHASFGDANDWGDIKAAKACLTTSSAPVFSSSADAAAPSWSGFSDPYRSPVSATSSCLASVDGGFDSCFNDSGLIYEATPSQRTPTTAASLSTPRSGLGFFLNDLHPILTGLETAFSNAGVKDQQTLLTLEADELDSLLDTFQPEEATYLQKIVMKHSMDQRTVVVERVVMKD